MDLLAGLNDRQKEAVLAPNGPLLIVAGAGSGKTKVVVHRIARFIAEGTDPAGILAVTFTNKAAREMLERITSFVEQGGIPQAYRWRRPWVGTFHSLGVSILRSDGEAIGVPRNFTILDQDDSLSVIKNIVKAAELDPKQYQPSHIRYVISKLKNDFISPEEYGIEAESNGPYPQIIHRCYESYEEELKKAKSLDFDDLLVKTVRLLKTSKEAFETYQRRWSAMFVDEYQDTNPVQYALTKLLASGHENITVVGDADQAIYSWRGADFRNILKFESDWPGARVITLEQNYRSTQMILEAANTVIQKNVERKEKNLWTENARGDTISVAVAEDERKEADMVTRSISRLKGTGIPLREIAILYRTNAQSRAVEEALIKRGVPYRLLGGVRFYERKEVKDILAYLRLAANPDDHISLQRVINTPTRGIGKTLASKYLSGFELSDKEQQKIAVFTVLMAELRELFRTKPPTELTEAAIKKSGYERFLRDGSPEGEDRWANVLELLTVTQEYDSMDPPRGMEKFLEDVALISDADLVDKSQDAVHVMTIHAAKGLEFEAVFVVGLEEGIFPHSLSLSSPKELEEERRLCYVALTRAKTRLYLTLARTRSLYGEKMWNEPSRFLRDIPEHLFNAPIDFYGDGDEYIIGYET